MYCKVGNFLRLNFCGLNFYIKIHDRVTQVDVYVHVYSYILQSYVYCTYIYMYMYICRTNFSVVPGASLPSVPVPPT